MTITNGTGPKTMARMRRHAPPLLLLLPIALVFFLTGCVQLKQPAPRIAYHTLEYEPPAVDLAGPPLDAVLRLERFTAAPLYDTDRMVYRAGDFDRTTYFYHRWRARPADLVTYFLGRDLREANLFRAVALPGTGLTHTHTLEGTVDEFLEWDGEAGWEAVLTIHVVLLKEREPDISQRVVFQKGFSSRQPCADQRPEEVARAMSLAMAEVSRQTMTAVYQSLAPDEMAR